MGLFWYVLRTAGVTLRDCHPHERCLKSLVTCVDFTGDIFVGIAADLDAVSVISGCFGYPDTFRLANAGGSGAGVTQRSQQPQ